MKPVTWIPLIWGVLCGAAASGSFHWQTSDVLASLACMVMSGPLLAGFTQTINDYYDREIDAINEPTGRSLRASPWRVKVQIWVLLIAGIAVSYGLDLGQATPPGAAAAGLGRLVCELYLFDATEAQAKRLAR